MKLSRIEHSHHITQSEVRYLGGKFNFIELLKMGGNGSPKFLYNKGIEKLDAINESFDHKCLCSVELLKTGFILWWNKFQTIRAILIKYDEIEAIKINSFKVNAKPLVQTDYILTAGDIEIQIKDEKSIHYYLPASTFKKVLRFFSKKFPDKLVHKSSTEEAICSDDIIYTNIYLHGINY